MTNLLAKYRRWQSKKKAQRVANWQTKRAEGKTRFIAKFSLLFFLIVFGLQSIPDLIYGTERGFTFFIVRFVLLFLAGLWLGNTIWRSREKEYLENSH